MIRIDKPIDCFWLDDMRATSYRLRRYALTETGRKCPSPHGYCQAMSEPVGNTFDDPSRAGVCGTCPPQVSREDPRWPKACAACSQPFAETDEWQVFGDRLLTRPRTLQILTWAEAAPGAMMDASWWPEKGPDGLVLLVKLPDGSDWMVDGPSSGGDRKPWSRTGKPPLVTASPSIQTTHWHGWLREGKLWQA